jgi:hypothetical protein
LRERETPKGGYAPSEYRLKRWPIEALLGEWYPHFSTGEIGFLFGRRTRGTRPDVAGPVIGIKFACPTTRVQDATLHSDLPPVANIVIGRTGRVSI